MKLLGWMHRKFWQNNGDGEFDDSTGDHHQLRPSATHPFSYEELMLDGLLTIGTLGLSTEPTKDEMPVHEYEELAAGSTVEAIAEKEETEAATEMDMMLINAELGKVLEAEVEKTGDRLSSSARPSHVAEASTECPLQEYLFGANVVAATEEKEKRASLGELFMIEEGRDQNRKEGGSDHVSGEGSETGAHLMMKRLLTQRKSTSAVSCGDATTSTDKFQKIMQIFHRKVHPDNSTATKRSKANKCTGFVPCIGSCFSGGRGSDLMKTSKCKCRKGHIASPNCSEDPPPFSLSGSDSTGSRSYWIKTDEDYLVLEL